MDKELHLIERINKSKSDLNQLNDLIADYKPYIAKTVKEHVGHYVSYGEDDELSIGMLAFTEAVKSYDPTKGAFLSFAKRVICMRLIDYYRKQLKYEKKIKKSSRLSEDVVHDYADESSLKSYAEREENRSRKLEILLLKDELSQWGISFSSLIEHSPKHEKVRNQYLKIAQSIIKDPDLLGELNKSKRLPLRALQTKFLFNRKKIERGRIYIIACVIIINGDYNYIQEYLKWR